MKIASLVLSLFMLAYLSLALINSESGEEKIHKTRLETEVNLPKPLDNSLLTIEKKWMSKQKEERLPKEVAVAKRKDNKHKFMIGSDSYLLLGIFHEPNNSFVLLKDNKDNVIKLKREDELPGGYALTEVNTNIIAFVVNNERVEFKLFETKSHAKN